MITYDKARKMVPLLQDDLVICGHSVYSELRSVALYFADNNAYTVSKWQELTGPSESNLQSTIEDRCKAKSEG